MDQRLAIGGGVLVVSLMVSVGLIAYRLGTGSNNKSPDLHLDVKPVQAIDTKPSTPSSAPKASAGTVATAAPAPTSTPKGPLSLDEAIAEAGFGDGFNAPHQGVVTFLPWATQHLIWDDLEGPKVPQTDVARVLRDADQERGHRLCMRGKIGQILGEDVQGQRVYSGGMGGVEGVVRFAAVGAVDDVFDGTMARFCGIVVGRESFLNSSGGTTHSVRAVGMFDVPANRKRTRSTPAKL